MSRDKVLQAAVEVFAEKGYHQASMDDIALRANVAKGTLYYHFSGKAELFRTIVSDGLRQLRSRIDTDLKAGLRLEEQIRRIVRHNVRLFTENSGLARIVFHELSNGIDQEVLTELNGLRDEYAHYIADILEEGRKVGLVRAVNCRLAACGMIGLLDNCCAYLLSHGEEVTREEVESFLYTTATAALLRAAESQGSLES